MSQSSPSPLLSLSLYPLDPFSLTKKKIGHGATKRAKRREEREKKGWNKKREREKWEGLKAKWGVVRNKKKRREGLDTRGQKSDPIEIASSSDTWRNSSRGRLRVGLGFKLLQNEFLTVAV